MILTSDVPFSVPFVSGFGFIFGGYLAMASSLQYCFYNKQQHRQSPAPFFSESSLSEIILTEICHAISTGSPTGRPSRSAREDLDQTLAGAIFSRARNELHSSDVGESGIITDNTSG